MLYVYCEYTHTHAIFKCQYRICCIGKYHVKSPETREGTAGEGLTRKACFTKRYDSRLEAPIIQAQRTMCVLYLHNTRSKRPAALSIGTMLSIVPFQAKTKVCRTVNRSKIPARSSK